MNVLSDCGVCIACHGVNTAAAFFLGYAMKELQWVAWLDELFPD